MKEVLILLWFLSSGVPSPPRGAVCPLPRLSYCPPLPRLVYYPPAYSSGLNSLPLFQECFLYSRDQMLLPLYESLWLSRPHFIPSVVVENLHLVHVAVFSVSFLKVRTMSVSVHHGIPSI